MSDIEKGFEPAPNMPPPSYHSHAGNRTSNFQGPYEAFVNDNMRAMTGNPGRPAQTFETELPKRDGRFPSKKRLAVYFAIGCLIALAMGLIAVFVLGRHGKNGRAGKDGKDASVEDVRTVTELATPTTSSSTSVSVSTTTTTTLSRTTKHHTTTVITTASIPQSIADAASSYYGAWSSSLAADLASGRSIESAALTRYPETTPTPTPSTLTTVTTATPPPVTVVQTTTMSNEGRAVFCRYDAWRL